jgi:hypothetical protein
MSNRIYKQDIVFCSSNIHDHYKYSDIFQIYPVDEPRATPTSYIREVPMYLEYWIDADNAKKTAPPVSCGGVLTHDEYQNNYLKDLLRQLTIYTGVHFFANDYKLGWSIPVIENTVFPDYSKESIFSANIYYQKPVDIKEFTEIGITQFKTLPGEGYERFKSKESMNQLFEKYFNFNDKKLIGVRNSMSLVAQSMSLSWRMKSLSFILLVSAVETLIDLERELTDPASIPCVTCGAVEYKPTKNYINFMKLNCNEKGNKIKRFLSEVYDKRSKIVHTGNLLLGDVTLDWDNFLKEKEEEQLLMAVEAYTIQSIRGWILSQ